MPFSKKCYLVGLSLSCDSRISTASKFPHVMRICARGNWLFEGRLIIFISFCLQIRLQIWISANRTANRTINTHPFNLLYFTLLAALSSVCTISFSLINSANRRDTFDRSFSCKLSNLRLLLCMKMNTTCFIAQEKEKSQLNIWFWLG